MPPFPLRHSHAFRVRTGAVLLALLLLAAAVPATAATYVVGPGASCTHTTLQAALDAANANPGPDTVRIVRTATWTAQQISTDTDQNVEIVGGYAACTSAAPDGKTTLSGAGGNARSVLALRGNGVFVLRNLVIRDGDQAGDDDGGGIHFLGGGIVEISDSEIAQNSAEDGGGIYAQGTTTAAELVIGANVSIAFNTARRHGGGVVAQNIEMTMIAPGSMLFMNTAAARGGGLLVASGEFVSYAYIGSSGVGGLGAVYGNHAAIGGGIAVLAGDDSGKDAEVQLFSTDSATPLGLRDNTASERGGGIDLHPDGQFGGDPNANATARLTNVAIEGNTAPVGAAVNLSYNSYGPLGEEAIGGRLHFNTMPFPHPAAAPCPHGAPCGYIRDNDTLNTTGAVVHLSENADVFGSRIAIEGNRGGWLMYLSGEEFTTLDLDNSLIVGNTVENALIRDDQNQDAAFSLVEMHYLTITGNTIGANGVLSFNEDMTLTRSIVDQPGKALFATDVGSSGGNHDVQYVLVSQGPASSGMWHAAPRFVDPARGDYMPRAGSVAVDEVPVMDDRLWDLHSHRRNVDIPNNPNGVGVSDIGALEREYLQPLVLNWQFDDDLNLWAAISESTWDGSQDAGGNPASGSARAPMSSIIESKRAKLASGRSQCVHLPGPGTYRLNGAARVLPSSNPPLVANRAGLAWELRYNDGDFGCQTGAPDITGLHPLASTGTWTRPATAATITIPPGRWTPNTSLTVIFDVQGAPANAPTAWFDDVILEPGEPDLPPEMFSDGFE